jgi:hypothetical protein
VVSYMEGMGGVWTLTDEDGELLSMFKVGFAMMAVLVVGVPPGPINVVVVVMNGGA